MSVIKAFLVIAICCKYHCRKYNNRHDESIEEWDFNEFPTQPADHVFIPSNEIAIIIFRWLTWIDIDYLREQYL